MDTDSSCEPSSWPPYKRAVRQPLNGEDGIRSLPSSFRLQEEIPDTMSMHEEMFITLAGIPLSGRNMINRHAINHVSPRLCQRPCCGSTIAHVVARCYVSCYTIALATWACIHANLMFEKLSGNGLGRFGLVAYGLAFSLPCFDSLFNLFFTAYQLRMQDIAVDEDERTASWNMGKPQPFWLRLLFLFVLLLIFARVVILLLLCDKSTCSANQYLMALSGVFEALPLLASSLAMCGNTNVMLTKLDELRAKIIDMALTPDQCVSEYNTFKEFARARGQRWQMLVVVSTSMEVYYIFFQTLWCFKPPNVATVDWAEWVIDSEIISLFVILVGFFIAAKLVPLAVFNYKVKQFAYALVVKSHELIESTSTSGNPQELKNFQEVVSTISLLFLSEPPCLKVLHFVIDNKVLAKLAASVVLTSMSRSFVNLVDAN